MNRHGVREAGPGDRAQAIRALTDAFASDPLLRWLLPDDRPRRAARLRRLFALELAWYVLPTGRALIADDGSGANLELPPGGWHFPRQMPLPVAIGWLRVFGTGLGRATRLQSLFEREHLREPHYYVRYVGVATRFQGRGVGTALLRPTLERCDREGLPAYLEASSERSAALYERLGFVHLGEQRIPDGGPPFWPMRRPPSERAAGEHGP